MTGMRERLGAVLDVDVERFSGAEFSEARLGAVLGSVKRRRAARAAGVGSVSAMGAGALVLGAANVPWSSFVVGVSPAASPSVVCTTSTPFVVDAPAQDVPQGATMAFVDNTTGDVAFGEERGGGATVWYNGQVVGTAEDGHAIAMTFPSGETFEFTPVSTGGGGLFQGSDVSVLSIDDYLEQAAPSASGSPGAVVTCVTTTPEPSESPSPTTSASPSPSPTISASEVAAAVASPFICGAEIPSDEYGAYEFGISDITWESPDQVNAEAAPYNLTDGSPWHAEGDADVLRVVADGSWFSSADVQNLGGGAGSEDPVVFANSDTYPPVAEDNVAEGLSFVAVRDGAVIATLPRTDTEPNPHVFVTTDEIPAINPVGYFLNPDDAWTVCDGQALGTDWALYAVAGVTLRHADGTVDNPMYAWKKIEPQS